MQGLKQDREAIEQHLTRDHGVDPAGLFTDLVVYHDRLHHELVQQVGEPDHSHPGWVNGLAYPEPEDPAQAVVKAWMAGARPARTARQEAMRDHWPALADALDALAQSQGADHG